MNFMAEKCLTCLIYNCKRNHGVHFLNIGHGKLFVYLNLINMFSNWIVGESENGQRFVENNLSKRLERM